VWWLTLGIEPLYIPPSSPQDNGRHERMHRTLKAQTSKPPSATARDQQARFDLFRRHYNEERPHEALNQTPPARHWQPSARPLPARIDPPWYDAEHETRVVRPNGDIRWRGQRVFIGEALAGQTIGLTELEAGHLVRFCTRDLGVIAPGCRFHRFAPPAGTKRCRSKLSGMFPVDHPSKIQPSTLTRLSSGKNATYYCGTLCVT
jgi:Integrase core domain